MDKKWCKVTFYAEMDPSDIRAMQKYLYETMQESLQIGPCEGLQIQEDDLQEHITAYEDCCLDDDGLDDDLYYPARLVLDSDDLEMDEDENNTTIDKQVFDDYQEDVLLRIYLPEEGVENTYRMIDEDENYIYLEFIDSVPCDGYDENVPIYK